MTEHEIPSPVQAVVHRIDARRASALARHPEPPPAALATCDGWGLIPVLASDGSGYEPAACLGCSLCSTVRPPVPGLAFSRMPVIDDLEEF